MKFPPKFRLPKLRLPSFRLPRLGLPKLTMPKLALPKWRGRKRRDAEPHAEQFGATPRSGKMRPLVLGASALALVAAGGLAWVFLRPMLMQDNKAPQQTAAEAEPKPAGATAPMDQAAAEKAAQEKPAVEKPQGTPEPVAPVQGGAAQGESAHSEPAHPEPAHAEPAHGAPAHGAPAHGEKAKEDKGGEKQAAAPLPLPPPLDEPEILIRQLQDLQERVAVGDPAAFEEQPKLLARIAKRFDAQPPEIWSRPRNAHVLALYLLSGGRSAVGRKILAQGKFAASEEALAKGAVAYLEAVEGADRDALLGLDPRALDSALGAQVAFVQSILLTAADRPQAIARLDLARLLAPGGLVEEAALRREVGLLAETTEFEKFAGLARQYWQRFRASPYADNFLRQFLVSSARISLRIKLAEWAQLDEFIDSLSPDSRRALYLVVAQTAAVSGNFELGDMAARRALELAPGDTPERQRALLYRAGAEVGAADAAQAAALLRDVERSRLPPGDQPIYDAVAMVAARIYRPPESRFAAPPPGGGDDPALLHAEKSVKEADAVMEEVRKSMQRKSR